MLTSDRLSKLDTGAAISSWIMSSLLTAPSVLTSSRLDCTSSMGVSMPESAGAAALNVAPSVKGTASAIRFSFWGSNGSEE
ncbi:hypothetical protein J1614_000759 [Plenodomus biglobosus]|nr:hypothetical protein J1614_000759 [Plenodomus biglobosus]